MIVQRVKELVRPVVKRSPALTVALVVAGRDPERSTRVVDGIYNNEWARYDAWLDRATTLEGWLSSAYDEAGPELVNVDGRLEHRAFDHRAYVIDVVAEAIRRAFPAARSVTEFGSGAGQNVLGLKKAMPDLALYGYELTSTGVGVARRAAGKFGLDASFAELDYLADPEERWVHPRTDVGLTVYSLHEVPRRGELALRNMLAHVKQGLVLFEPAPENFPRTYRGVLGRVYARARDYLHGLDASIRALPVKTVESRVLGTSDNPLFYPTLYIVKK